VLSGDASQNGAATPPYALLICLSFTGLGLLAAEGQRRSLRR
jgi:hypothetical protein